MQHTCDIGYHCLGQAVGVYTTASHNVAVLFCPCSTDRAITGVSTYNVVPDQAAYYFNKIQCFCFEEQRLRPGEVVDMPVFFYIDPELVEDRHCR